MVTDCLVREFRVQENWKCARIKNSEDLKPKELK
jgi:hypothetical protein